MFAEVLPGGEGVDLTARRARRTGHASPLGSLLDAAGLYRGGPAVTDFLIGVGFALAGIFIIYRRDRLVRVQIAEIEVFGTEETPAWKRYYRVMVTIGGIFMIGLGLVFMAKAVGLAGL